MLITIQIVSYFIVTRYSIVFFNDLGRHMHICHWPPAEPPPYVHGTLRFCGTPAENRCSTGCSVDCCVNAPTVFRNCAASVLPVDNIVFASDHVQCR